MAQNQSSQQGQPPQNLPGPKSEEEEIVPPTFNDEETVTEFLEEDFTGEAGEAEEIPIEVGEPVQVEPVTETIPLQQEEPEPENALPETLVVEQVYVPVKQTKHIEDAIPKYRDRRDKWGTLWAITYGVYAPVNYQPNFSNGLYENVYGTGFGSLLELTGSAKYNLSIGSLTLGAGAGFFKKNSTDGNNTLSVIPIRLEGSLVLDTLLKEPLAAPYVLGGAYINIYKETQGDVAFNGQTQVAPYFGLGVNIQLDWLDKSTALNSYLEYGLQNTYIYIEGRSFISSGGAQDPDFSTSFQLAAGAKFEY